MKQTFVLLLTLMLILTASVAVAQLGEPVQDFTVVNAVSYTHLDVYKRQPTIRSRAARARITRSRLPSALRFRPAAMTPRR